MTDPTPEQASAPTEALAAPSEQPGELAASGDDLFGEGPEGDEPMSFFEHLAELRMRLIRAAIGLVIAFGGCWVFIDELRYIINRPFFEAWDAVGMEGPPSLQVLNVLDGFLTDVRIAITFGIFVAGPVLFYQLWMFIAPGLYDKEKRLVVPFVAVSVVMFVSGAWFCYELVLPYATRWFLEYALAQSGASDVQINAHFTFPDYTKYTTRLLMGFGGAFQFPLGVFFLARAGILTHLTLLRYWKVSVLIICVAAAFLTPPDPLTLVFLAVPMVGLFFVSVGVAYWASKAHRELAAEAGA